MKWLYHKMPYYTMPNGIERRVILFLLSRWAKLNYYIIGRVPKATNGDGIIMWSHYNSRWRVKEYINQDGKERIFLPDTVLASKVSKRNAPTMRLEALLMRRYGYRE